MSRRILLNVVVMGLLCGLLAGCGAKVSKSNYDKVTTGMTVSEVEGILGKGTDEASGSATVGKMTGSGKMMTWKDGDKTITITFVNDKVSLKTQSGL